MAKPSPEKPQKKADAPKQESNKRNKAQADPAALKQKLILTGAVIDAAEALRIGLVSRVLPAEELLPACLELARRIAAQPRLAVQYAKAAVNGGLGAGLEAGMALEQELFGLCFATEDQKEGMAAFLEKRSPAFTGR